MPLYEFRCRCCGERFERLVRGATSEEIVCPHCRAAEVERLFSAFARVGGPRCDPPASGGG